MMSTLLRQSLLCAVLLLASQAHAQTSLARSSTSDTFAKTNRELVAKNPEGLGFALTFKDKQKQFQFHPGEIIRLELAFSSTLPETYTFNAANYDRSGRLDIDSFVVNKPDDVTDPLIDYYRGGLFGFMGGGLFGSFLLAKEPQLINYDLNEWIRFDKPGKYRLYVVSGRITKGKPFHSGATAVSAVSNVIEFEIVPANPEWERKTLSDVRAVLDSAEAKEDRRREACRVLRFLGTEGAIKESIRRYRGQDPTCDFQYDFGLLGAPRRAFAVAEMEAAINAPDQPITGGFLRTIAFLSYLSDHPNPLPDYPRENESEQKVWQSQMAQRRSAYDELVERYTGQLAMAVAQKQGAALALSLKTLVDFGGPGDSEIDRGRRQQLVPALARAFLDLPHEAQQSLLEYRWSELKDPAMLPVLRQLYQHPPDMHVLPAPFPGLALQRIYELAPDEGRQLILTELARPQLRVGIHVLRLLPDEELPELEDVIIERAINPREGFNQQETALALVNRYASAAALPRLRVAFENRIGNIACSSQESLLAYFLRADEDFGIEMLRKALTERKQTRCYANALTTAADTRMSPKLKELAIVSLDDKNEDVMAQAAAVLSSHGDAANKAKVKARIKQQLDQWRAEKRDPEKAISASNFLYVGSFAETLLNRYAHAVAWFTDEDELKELEDLCLTENCREQARIWAANAGTILTLHNAVGDEPPAFTLAQYDQLTLTELKTKLLQFPGKTTFTWQAEGGERNREDKLFNEIKDYVAGHEMKLVTKAN
jgi:hypothetical protein